MKKILGLITLLLVFLSVFIIIYNYSIDIIEKEERYSVELEKCIDGDTVWLNNNGIKNKYRLLGIDSPESNDEFGEIATNYTCNILKNAKTIEIEYDKLGRIKDKYNRELVWVFVDDELLQTKILSSGLARVKYIYANYDYLNTLYESEYNAINNRLGIWKYYEEETYYNYYTITFNYIYKNESVSIIENNVIKNIENPYKDGCRFIGWKNGNYLFDLSTKINKDYKLIAEFDC